MTVAETKRPAGAGGAARVPGAAGLDAEYLRDRAAVIAERARSELRVRAAMDGPAERDDGGASALWEDTEARADAAARVTGRPPRLRLLAGRLGLTRLETDILVAALLPDVIPELAVVYSHLNDGVPTRRATAATALLLSGEAVASQVGRAALASDGALRGHGLVHLVGNEELPRSARELVVPDRVLGYLLGEDLRESDAPAGVRVRHPGAGTPCDGFAADLVEAVRACGQRTPPCPVYLRDSVDRTAAVVAHEALSADGLPVIDVDAREVCRAPEPEAALAFARREAALVGGGIVCGPVGVAPGDLRMIAAALTRPRTPLVLYGARTWESGAGDLDPATFTAPVATHTDRNAAWRRLFDACPPDRAAALLRAVEPYRLDYDRMAAVWSSARRVGPCDGGHPTPEALVDAAGRCNDPELERLARRVTARVGWESLVVPQVAVDALRELSLRARHRDLVLREWGMRPGGGRGSGVVALFAGPSGTGKTMAAEVVARDLGLDMYVVNVATVVDKYIGETEKNLEHVFSAAAEVNGLLVFDEADALFGRRSEVKDAHDRYANLETAYLLQRLETFDGIAVLTTNLRSNLDDAFVRRLDAVVEFPMPDEQRRRLIWERCLAPLLRAGDGVDLAFIARSFPLSGGAIRAAAVTAAFLAAGRDGVLLMSDVVEAVRGEYRKSGNLPSAAEFGPYHRGAETPAAPGGGTAGC